MRGLKAVKCFGTSMKKRPYVFLALRSQTVHETNMNLIMTGSTAKDTLQKSTLQGRQGYTHETGVNMHSNPVRSFASCQSRAAIAKFALFTCPNN
jgi:hypothetical protein